MSSKHSIRIRIQNALLSFFDALHHCDLHIVKIVNNNNCHKTTIAIDLLVNVQYDTLIVNIHIVAN